MSKPQQQLDQRSPQMEHSQVAEGIFTIANVLDPAECEALIHDTEEMGYEAAPITTPWGFQMRPEIRNNTRVMIDDPARAESLWERLRAWIPPKELGWRAVGLNERFRFYRYHPGQRFYWHIDGPYRRNISEQSRLTLMIYLNEGFEGGTTGFREHEVVPVRGSALIFDHALRHCGAEVTDGVKYVMRTDVMYRRVEVMGEAG